MQALRKKQSLFSLRTDSTLALGYHLILRLWMEGREGGERERREIKNNRFLVYVN